MRTAQNVIDYENKLRERKAVFAPVPAKIRVLKTRTPSCLLHKCFSQAARMDYAKEVRAAGKGMRFGAEIRFPENVIDYEKVY